MSYNGLVSRCVLSLIANLTGPSRLVLLPRQSPPPSILGNAVDARAPLGRPFPPSFDDYAAIGLMVRWLVGETLYIGGGIWRPQPV